MIIRRIPFTAIAGATLFLASIHGCGDNQESVATDATDASAITKPVADTDAVVSPGKMSAPLTISYQVIGNPVVGQPVAVNLQVVSTQGEQPVTLRYRANDASSMQFPESQANTVQLTPAMSEAQRAQQITVVPQREGRLFLNVSAEISTATGSMFKSLAVPIQVGAAPEDAARNGELQETADGEQVISMPAEEKQ